MAYAKKIHHEGSGMLAQLQSLLTIIESLPHDFIFGYADASRSRGGLFKMDVLEKYTILRV